MIKQNSIILYACLLCYVKHLYSIFLPVSYQEHCFVNQRSTVVWVVSLYELKPNQSERIMMQTQTNTPFKDSWKNLTKCERYEGTRNYTIKCEIDDDWIRLTYHLRVVRFFDSKFETLFIKNNQYQHGLLCFQDHGISNLTYSDVTSHSVNISWNYYTWDIEEELIKETNIFIYPPSKNRRRIPVDFNNMLNQIYKINWLEACTRYRVVVENIYYSIENKENQSSSLNIQTKCTKNIFSKTEFVTIMVCIILAFVGLTFSGYILYRRRLNGTRKGGVDTMVLIDENEMVGMPSDHVTSDTNGMHLQVVQQL